MVRFLPSFILFCLLFRFFREEYDRRTGNGGYEDERLAHGIVAAEVEYYRGDVVDGMGLVKVLLDYRGGRAVGVRVVIGGGVLHQLILAHGGLAVIGGFHFAHGDGREHTGKQENTKGDPSKKL